jgi:hypothetical protein
MTMYLMSCEGVDREEKDVIEEKRGVQTSDVLCGYGLVERLREGGEKSVGECFRARC